MIYEENVRVFLKRDLGIFAIHAGRHKKGLTADHLDQLTTFNVDVPKIKYAEKLTTCVGKAIAACSDKSRKILTSVYLLDHLNRIAMKEIGYGQSRYWELKQIALDEFMDNFAKYQKQIGLEPAFKLVK